MSDIKIKQSQLQNFFSAGVVVIVISLIIWLVPSIMFANFETSLVNLDLKETLNNGLSEFDQQVRINSMSSITWWEITKLRVIDPVATIVLLIGFFLIAYAFIVRYL